MKISFESKGDFDVVRSWLKRVTENKPTTALNQIAREGERSLANNTPRDTGETASGWVSEVTTKGNTTEIVWKNNAHPESSVNVAKLIETGHGTRTGGYVAPKPYIKRAMEPVWGNTDNAVKELIK
jgi:hypothetical protein